MLKRLIRDAQAVTFQLMEERRRTKEGEREGEVMNPIVMLNSSDFNGKIIRQRLDERAKSFCALLELLKG